MEYRKNSFASFKICNKRIHQSMNTKKRYIKEKNRYLVHNKEKKDKG